MRQLRRLGATAAASLLAGCASSELVLAPARPDRPWNPPAQAGEIVAAPPSPGPAPGGYVLPANPQMAKLETPPALEAGHAYSLAELIDIAESHNPQTRIAWDQARDAALAAGIARSAFLPDLTASVVGGYQSGHQDKSLDGVQTSERSTVSGSISAISVKWLLFDFGGRAAVLDAAKQASVISNIKFTAAHQDLIYRVSLAFYADAAARARQATAVQNLEDARAVQAAADARFAHGEGTVVETAQAHQATAQAEYAKIRADGIADDTRQALINAIGVSPLTKLTVEDLSRRRLSADAGAQVDELVSAALSRRPDVLSAYAARKASLDKVREAKAEFMPKVFLSASGAYSSSNLQAPALPGFGREGAFLNLNGNELGGTVLLGVTVPIFDGGVRDAALKRARIDVERADAQLTQVRNDAAREVVSAATSVKTSVAAHHSAEALVSASQTSFDSALAAYQRGVGSITDVTVAESKLLDARNLATDSYSAALSAAAGLAFSAGALGAPPTE
jgi:outer membrane protein TolC